MLRNAEICKSRLFFSFFQETHSTDDDIISGGYSGQLKSDCHTGSGRSAGVDTLKSDLTGSISNGHCVGQVMGFNKVIVNVTNVYG